MKRPENSAHFPASHLPHPFPSKPRERRRTRSYKKPPQERSEEKEEEEEEKEEEEEEEDKEKGAGKERGGDGPGGSPGLCSPLLPWGRGRRGRGGTPRRAWLCVFRVHLVAGETSRDAPVAWGEGSLQDSGAS